ncbi:MAG: ABC transporter permease [Anaerolineaceae bacterium]|nr:ABC transporter permease [Anaerolineaceae bacterium]
MAIQKIAVPPAKPKVPTTRIVWGIILILVGLFMFFVFGSQLESVDTTTLNFNLNQSNAIEIPSITLPSQVTIYVLAFILILVGAYQLAVGIQSTGLLAGVLGLVFVFAFLLWGAAGTQFNLEGMISSSLVRATPIALAALVGVISERSGVVNIGIEGMLLFSAQTAVVAASLSDNLYVGLLVAILTGGLFASLHAVLCIRFRVNQIVSGVAINILGTGLTSFFASKFLEPYGDLLNNSGTFPIVPIPILSKIPILGPMLFENNIIVYLMMILVVAMHFMLFYTPWGLRTRAVGEHPKAADTLGVNVYLIRYVNVIIGGMIAGVGGAYFTIGTIGRFDQIMTAGKGFIGLAAMIFGKWTPIGAFFSSLIFGFADSLQVKLQILSVPIPSEFLLMAPYIITMVVLAGVVGRAMPPAADGEPYVKE